MSNFRSHERSDKIKWIVISIVVLLLVAAVIGIAVKLDRRTTDERLTSSAYSIGAIDVEGDVDKSIKTSIYTRNAISVEGLSITIAEKSKVKYSLYFYNVKGKFLEKKDYTSSYTSETLPEGAKTCKIVITPLEDDEITLGEILEYAGELTVRYTN